jgi:hypothetical protein
MRIGYFRLSEEWGPTELVAQAAMARVDAFFAAHSEHVLPRVHGE